MKSKVILLFLILACTVYLNGQNLDSVRLAIRAMSFEVPVFSPVPAYVDGAGTPVISLNGTWKFNPVGRDYNSAKEIEVPGEWEMQGFHVGKGNPATYWKKFTLPADWTGNRVRIRFDAVSSYVIVRINGRTAGSHEGSFAPFEFDITDALITGENTLEAEVQCETISDILACTSQYAAHPVGGILRKVTLYTLPEDCISGFSWNVKFDESYNDASLNFSSSISYRSGISSDLKLKFDLLDPEGRAVKLDENSAVIRVRIPGNEVSGSIIVPSPLKWDPEHPNLYLLSVSLLSDGRIIETTRQKIGFRQIELRGNRFFINNHPVKLKGVDRHEIHPLRGRSLTPELCRKDVEIFRAGNCNYIRTSHYPPSEEFLDACDELGMFVESEASLCWIQHGASPVWKQWNYLDSRYLPYMLRANHENVLAGRRHPCIIIWSLGNESRWSPLWERVNEEVKKLDPSRPTCFHDQCWTSFNNAGSRADVANYHYPGFNGPAECEKEKNRPTLFGEYMHVQCYARREIETDPSVRSDAWAVTLKQMVDSVYTYPACLGGAIWSGIDDIFHLSESKICGYGPWGPIDGWRREKPEYIGMKRSYSPVIITNLCSPGIAEGRITLAVENRYNFTNLNELEITAGRGNNRVKVSADIPPLARGNIFIDIRKTGIRDSLWLTFTDPRGFICAEEIITLATSRPADAVPVKIRTDMKESAGVYTIISGSNTFVIDKKTGAVTGILPDGEKVITEGAVPMLIPFNNDDGGAPNVAGNNYTQDIKPLDYSPVENFYVKKTSYARSKDGKIKITVSGTSENTIDVVLEYIFNHDGTITVNYDYLALMDFAGRERLRQFGLLFTLPYSYDRLAWERMGLWTVYPEYDINRLKGYAQASPRDLKYVEQPKEIPSWLWKDNANKLGTNDFKSTKDHIMYAALRNGRNSEVAVRSDGSQGARAWVDGGRIRFLIVGLNGPGSCGFFTGPRPDYKKGNHLSGSFSIGIK